MKRPLSLLTCIVIPLIILVFGIITAAIYGSKAYPAVLKDEIRAVIPPKFTTAVEIPGRYSLWAYSVGNFEDKQYLSHETMPGGVRFHVVDRKSGDFIPVSNLLLYPKSPKGEKANLIGSFDTIYPKQQITIVTNGLEQKTVIGLSSKSVNDIYQVFGSIAAIFLISLIAALSSMIILLHRRKKQILTGNR